MFHRPGSVQVLLRMICSLYVAKVWFVLLLAFTVLCDSGCTHLVCGGNRRKAVLATAMILWFPERIWFLDQLSYH